MRELLHPRIELPNGGVIARGILVIRTSPWGRCFCSRLNGFDDITVFTRTFLKPRRVKSSVLITPSGYHAELGFWWQLPFPDGLYEIKSRGKLRGNIRGLSPWHTYLDFCKGKITVLHRGQAVALMAERTGKKPPARRVSCSYDEFAAARAARALDREDIARRIIGKYLRRS
jgi:hypothetical protein